MRLRIAPQLSLLLAGAVVLSVVAVGGVSLGLVVLPLVARGETMRWVLLAGVALGSWRLFRACKRNGEIPL